MTGAELRTRRINQGLSQRALARELDIHESSVRRLEEEQSVRLPIAKKVADHFGVQVTDLPGMGVEAAA